MSIYLFVIDGLGMWNAEKKSTFQLLDEKCSFNDNDLSFLYKIGFKNAIDGNGNLLIPKSNVAGSLEGHREMMGYISTNQYDICQGFISDNIIEKIYLKTKIRCIGNIQGRGSFIIPKYVNYLVPSSVILYFGYDSTACIVFKEEDFFIEDIVDMANVLMKELYKNNIKIRKIIIKQYNNDFSSMKFRKEVFHKIKFDNALEALGFSKIVVNNKIQDILGLNCAEVRQCNTDKDCYEILFEENDDGFYFFNFPDFDSFAHQGNFSMCAKAIKTFNLFIESFWNNLKNNDYIVITSDHGVKIEKSDLSNTHVLENVLLLCLDKFGYYYFDGMQEGMNQIYKIIQNIKDGKNFSTSYNKLY